MPQTSAAPSAAYGLAQTENAALAAKLRDYAALLDDQAGAPFRARAYREGRRRRSNSLPRPASAILAAEGREGLDALPGHRTSHRRRAGRTDRNRPLGPDRTASAVWRSPRRCSARSPASDKNSRGGWPTSCICRRWRRSRSRPTTARWPGRRGGGRGGYGWCSLRSPSVSADRVCATREPWPSGRRRPCCSTSIGEYRQTGGGRGAAADRPKAVQPEVGRLAAHPAHRARRLAVHRPLLKHLARPPAGPHARLGRDLLRDRRPA